MAMEMEEQQVGDGTKKRRSAADWEEGYKKVRKTIGWYNHKGGLAGGQIIYKDVKDLVESCDPRATLKVLKGLEEKAPEIRNPTAWFRSQLNKVGAELDPKVKTTIGWFNKQGTLAGQIMYAEVRGPLSQLPIGDQLKIVNGLEGKEAQVTDPTKWICAAAHRRSQSEGGGSGQAAVSKSWQSQSAPGVPARKGTWVSKPSNKGGGKGDAGGAGLDLKVKKTIGWYNNSGLLQQQIVFDEVAGALAAVGTAQALQLLKGLETKGPEIRNPSAWLIKATQKMS